MRKIFYTLGAAAAVATPLIAVVSCGSNEDKAETKNVAAKQLQVFASSNLTVEVRIPDFDKTIAFDQATFDASKFIEEWLVSGPKSAPRYKHEMIPYKIDETFKVSGSNSKTLGDLMDELNKKYSSDIFKFNQTKAEAGEMGRFLMGIRKSDSELKTIKDVEHYGYWGMHFEDNGHNTIIQNDDEFYSYISLSSPSNEIAVQNSHENFDRNESRHAFDQRLPKGVDNIPVHSNDVFDLNLWRMI